MTGDTRHLRMMQRPNRCEQCHRYIVRLAAMIGSDPRNGRTNFQRPEGLCQRLLASMFRHAFDDHGRSL